MGQLQPSALKTHHHLSYTGPAVRTTPIQQYQHLYHPPYQGVQRWRRSWCRAERGGSRLPLQQRRIWPKVVVPCCTWWSVTISSLGKGGTWVSASYPTAFLLERLGGRSTNECGLMGAEGPILAATNKSMFPESSQGITDFSLYAVPPIGDSGN